MGADPEPDHFVSGSDAERPIVQTDPNRIDRLGGMDLSEGETVVVRVLQEEAVRPPGLMLNGRRQVIESGAEPLGGL